MVNRTEILTKDCVTSVLFLSKRMRPSSRTVASAPRPPAPTNPEGNLKEGHLTVARDKT